VPGLAAGDDHHRFRWALVCAALFEVVGLAALLSTHSVYRPPPGPTQPAPIRVRIVPVPPVARIPPSLPEPKLRPHPIQRQLRPMPAPHPRERQRKPLPARALAVPTPPLPVLRPPIPVVAPAPAAVPMPVAPAVRRAATDRYAARLRSIIQVHVRVPAIVRSLHLRGRAIVLFRLRPDGALLWVRIGRSSGISPIDTASVAEVRSLRYPPFTTRMPKRPLTFSVAVHMTSR